MNFRALGDDGALCQTCRAPALDATARCKHVQFYAILGKMGEKPTVKVELGCALGQYGLDDLLECQTCPDFKLVLPESGETIERRGAPPRLPVGHP